MYSRHVALEFVPSLEYTTWIQHAPTIAHRGCPRAQMDALHCILVTEIDVPKRHNISLHCGDGSFLLDKYYRCSASNRGYVAAMVHIYLQPTIFCYWSFYGCLSIAVLQGVSAYYR
jgi:hypothetical protein